MKSKKLTAILLAFIMLTTPILSSCSEKSNNDEGSNTSDTVGNLENVETEPELTPMETLPEYDYDGYQLDILTDTIASWWLITIGSEDLTGEIINDTVYQRNSFVADRYNATINVIDTTEASKQIENAVTSDTHDYDVVWQMYCDLLPVGEKGYLTNLYNVNEFNLDSAWWDRSANKSFTMGGKLYFALNDIDLHAIGGSGAGYFSKTLLNNHGLENPYDLVRSKEWTIDKMSTMVDAVYSDTNGDGQRGEGDTYGLITGVGQYLSLLNAAGQMLVTKEGEGKNEKFVLNMASEKVINLTEKICNILNNKNKTVIVNDDGWAYNTFYTDMALFYIMQMGSVDMLRDNMLNDFGIIPLPLSDSNQENYMTSFDSTVHAMCIPKNVNDIDKIGVMTETMAIYSDTYLIDAYYETTLKGKIARDKDSVEMLDLLIDTKTIDYSTANWAWGVANAYGDSVKVDGASQLASISQSVESKFMSLAQASLEAYRNIQD